MNLIIHLRAPRSGGGPPNGVVLVFIKTHWKTIAGLILAVVGVLWPEGGPAVERFLTVFASILIALGMGSTAARLAVRGEARRLGLISRPLD